MQTEHDPSADSGWQGLRRFFDAPLPLFVRLEPSESSAMVQMDDRAELARQFRFVVVTYPLRLGPVDDHDRTLEFWRR